MEIPVIIVTYNSSDTIKACIESVNAQRSSFSFKIWVVDNASTDRTPELIKYHYPEINLIENPANTGFSAAVNQVLTNIVSDYAILLNPDVLVEPNTFNHCINVLIDDKQIGCCGGVIRNEIYLPRSPGIGRIFFEQFFIHKIFPKNYHRLYFTTQADLAAKNLPAEADYTDGCFMCLNMDALRKIGLFDEDFFLYLEETELCHRMKSAGLKCVIHPKARIIHERGGSINKLPLSAITGIHRKSLLFYLKKTKPVMYGVCCRILLTCGDLFRSLSRNPLLTAKLIWLNLTV
ncbi:MAG: glycosyltransferase family 2 protein [Bacteroidia bacterium]|nr:glycosyltransferase family 2 protein [Bacteroidia bacterium]